MQRAKGRDLDLNAKKKRIHPRKASEELLLTGQQQWAKTKANPRTDGRICTPPPPPPLDDETRREESRGRAGVGAKAAASVAWRIQASTSREREGPVLALAGGLVPGRARFGISRGVCAGGVRARRGGGWQVDRSHLPSSDGRSLPCACLCPLPHRTCFVYKFSRPRPRIFTSSAILPAAAGSAGRASRAPECCRRTWK